MNPRSPEQNKEAKGQALRGAGHSTGDILEEVQGKSQPNHPALKEWRKKMRDQMQRSPDYCPLDREKAWEMALAKMAGWKAPGPDGIEAFWWKTFKGPAKVLKEMLWEMDGKTETPQWLVKGRTVMIPKGDCKGEPHQFR